MDLNKFDALTRAMADRRSTVKGGAAALAGLVGLKAVSATVEAQEVIVEGNRGPDKKCDHTHQCGKGLKCNDKGKCEYKGRNCGKSNYTCRKDKDCCGKLVCDRKRCGEKA
ncbi:MAG: hypothetical protein ACR2J8_04350 [Thermomicrobiales bacterium]